VAVLVVVLAAGGYLAAGLVVAAADRQAAEVVLSEVIADNNRIAHTMVTLSSPGTPTAVTQDAGPAKTAVDGFATDFRQVQGTVASDLARLRQTSAALRDQSGSPLVITQRGSLDQERSRADAVITAFSAAMGALQVGLDQMNDESAMLDAASALEAVMPMINRQDFHGALAALPAVDAKMQRAVTLSKGENVAPQMQAMTGAMATFVAVLEQFLRAAQSGDISATQATGTKLQGDADAVGRFDQAGFDAYESGLFKPYEDRYVTALQRVGFKVTLPI